MRKIFFLGSLSLLLLAGCGNTDEKKSDQSSPVKISAEELLKNSIPEVEVFIVHETQRTGGKISLSGTLVAKEEITISSEASGRVSKVSKQEGDTVENNETLMVLEANTNLFHASYSAAQAAFHNASLVLSLTRQSSNKDIANAKIAVAQAKISLQKIKNAKKFIIASSVSQRKSSEKTLEISRKNLKISETALAQIEENETKIQKNLLQNTSDNLSKIFVDFRSILRTTDELIGASPLNKDSNNEFEVYLEGTSRGVLLPTQDLWKKISRELLASEEIFSILEKPQYSREDEESLLDSIADAKQKSRDMRILLRNIESMLNKSIVSKTFTESTISNLKENNRQQQLLLESNIAAMTSIEQSLGDFHIQSPQRITNAQLSISVAESQVASAENTLANVVSAEGLTGVNQDSDLLAAEQQLLAVQSSLASTRSRGALSIQSANAQYDSAKSTLDQAKINLSKLVITAGVSGTVSQILRHDGDTVAPGTPLVVLADFSELKLEADVSLEESFILKVGMKAQITVEGIEDPIEGKISFISPQADSVTRRVSLEILMKNPKKIPANIFATAEIIFPKAEGVSFFLPSSSVLDEAGIYSVFVLVPDPENPQDTILEKRIITLVEENTDTFTQKKEMSTGLSAGEKILLELDILLSAGDKVIEKGVIRERSENKKSEKLEESSPQNTPEIKISQEDSSLEVSRDDISTAGM